MFPFTGFFLAAFFTSSELLLPLPLFSFFLPLQPTIFVISFIPSKPSIIPLFFIDLGSSS
jgi:hypothetical protein